MRIRSLLFAACLAAALLGIGVTVIVTAAASAENAAADAQSRAQSVAHEVTGLLTLTQEYARYMEPRAAEQWHLRHASIATALQAGDSAADRSTQGALVGLRSLSQDLPELFSRLEDIPRTDDPFTLRRREALLDQLLTSTQAMSDYAAQWFQDLVVTRQRANERFQLVAFGTPMVMLLMFVALTWLVRQRVLLPVQRLAEAAAVVGDGDLGYRIASDAPDELGELARRFDAMTAALSASRDTATQAAKRLRAITDNLPALIAYIDRDQTYRFANAHYRTVHGVDPESLIGKTIEQQLGTAIPASLRAEIEGALRGEHRSFDMQGDALPGVAGSGEAHLVVNFIPDIGPSQAVEGFYVMVSDITERKNAELARARSERLLRMITDNLPTMIAYIDSDERYRFANEQYRHLLGVDPAGLIGRSVRQGLGEASYATMKPYLDATLAGVRQQFERMNVIDGKPTWLLSEYLPDIDEQGKVVGLYAMTVDVTQHREAHARVRDSEQRLRAVTDNIPAMIGHFDTEERCHFANTKVLKVNGLVGADVTSHTLRSGIGEEAYALHEPHVKAVLRGEQRTFEGHLVRKGRDVYFKAHLVPDRADDGAVRGFYVMTFDVTDVRLAEVSRARSEQRLRQITDNLPVLISYIDRQQRLGFANGTFRTWLGVDTHSVLGKPIRDVLGAEVYEARRENIERALKGERVDFEGEMVGLGVMRATQTSFIPDIDSTGEVQGVYALTSDVSSLKRVEQQLQALARFDTLTGLPNRLHYNEKLPEALARSLRLRMGLALMFLDIDHFKAINDSLGHAAGDAVLKEFSMRLRHSVRATDTVARLAGDEFVVILEGLTDAAVVTGVADKIIAEMNHPFSIDAHLLKVTTSVGISYHPASKGETTPGALLERADKALYEAKSAGRNRHHMA